MPVERDERSESRFPLSAFRFPLSAFRFPLSAFRFRSDQKGRAMPDPNRPLSEGKIAALKRLKSAYDDAEDIGEPASQLAVRNRELIAGGAAASDLQWLMKLRYVEHLYDVTREGRSRRQFIAATGAPLRDNSCFVLSHSGKVYVERNLERRAAKKRALADAADRMASDAAPPDAARTKRAPPAAPRQQRPASTASRPRRSSGAEAPSANGESGVSPVPDWRAVQGELYFRGRLARRRGPKSAKLEESLLAKFSRARWARSISVRIPRRPFKTREQLKEAVRRLNDHMLVETLRFHVHQDGPIVWWEDRVIDATGSPEDPPRINHQ